MEAGGVAHGVGRCAEPLLAGGVAGDEGGAHRGPVGQRRAVAALPGGGVSFPEVGAVGPDGCGPAGAGAEDGAGEVRGDGGGFGEEAVRGEEFGDGLGGLVGWR